MKRRIILLLEAAAAALTVVALGIARYLVDPRFYFSDDMQTGVVGQVFEIGGALAKGEWPLLSNSSWVATAFAGEMQYGIFSPFVLGYDLLLHHLQLSLAGTTTFLSILHLGITAAGAYLLARDYELPPPLAAVVAFAASMNGYLVMWTAKTWFTLLSSFSWLPFYWLGMRRLARGGGSPASFAGTVLALYLLITVGWPGTNLMALVICAWFIGAAVFARRWREAVRLFLANLVAMLLTAPMLLVAIDYVEMTARAHMPLLNWAWRVPPKALLALILPTMRVDWHRWVSAGPHNSIEMAGGLVPLVGLVAAFAVLGRGFVRRRKFELSLLVAAYLWCALPSVYMFQWSFRWLPLFHLALAVVGALGLHDLARDEDALEKWRIRFETAWGAFAAGSRMPSVWFLILLVIAAIGSFLWDESFGLTMRLAFLTAFLGAGWLFADVKGSSQFRRWFPPFACAYSIVAALALFPVQPEFPEFQIGEVAKKTFPFNPGKTYIGIYGWTDMRNEMRMNDPRLRADPLFRPGNLAMASGLDFINGYSPLTPVGPYLLLGIRGIWGHTDEREARRILRMETATGAILEHMSVEGLTMTRSLMRRARIDSLPGWRVAAIWGPDILFERIGPPLPDVYFPKAVRTFNTGYDLTVWVRNRKEPAMPVTVVGPPLPPPCPAARVLGHVRERHWSAAEVDTTGCSGENLLVFARGWVTGFNGTVGGQAVRVEAADLMMPAVRVPAGFRGRVAVRYWPESLALGLQIAGATLAVTVLGLALWTIRRLRAGAA